MKTQDIGNAGFKPPKMLVCSTKSIRYDFTDRNQLARSPSATIAFRPLPTLRMPGQYPHLAVYSRACGADVSHYRDNTNLEFDAIIQSRQGNWCSFEVKLGGRQTDAAAATLLKFRDRIDVKSTGPSKVLRDGGALCRKACVGCCRPRHRQWSAPTAKQGATVGPISYENPRDLPFTGFASQFHAGVLKHHRMRIRAPWKHLRLSARRSRSQARAARPAPFRCGLGSGDHIF